MALAFRSSHNSSSQSALAQRREIESISKTKFRFPLTPEEQPIIPPVALFSALKTGCADPMGFPGVAECAVHLELLEAFLILKQKVVTSNVLDRALSIVPKDVLQTVGRKRERKRDPLFKTRQAVKWPVYVRLAASRFLQWWTSLSKILPESPGTGYFQLSIDTLPPIDVLMVWHAFLLNPVTYKTFCTGYGRQERHHLNFPWKEIHMSLSDNNRTFTLSPKAAVQCGKYVGAPDLFAALFDYSSHTARTRTTLHTLTSTAGKDAPLNALPEICLSNDFGDKRWVAVNVLAGQVQRQAIFVQKMGDQLWLRSPVLEGTLSRAIMRYERFLTLLKEHPKTLLVPIMDIDLVWHTALCSPRSYEETCLLMTGRIINHDDSLAEAKLNGGLKETVWIYETRFQEEYKICTCWECEGLRSELEKQEPNANIDVGDLAARVSDNVVYYKAVELARRSGKMLPVRLR